MTIKKDAKEFCDYRWLLLAVNRDKRSIAMQEWTKYVIVHSRRAYCSDGFRLHTIPCSMRPGTYQVIKNVKSEITLEPLETEPRCPLTEMTQIVESGENLRERIVLKPDSRDNAIHKFACAVIIATEFFLNVRFLLDVFSYREDQDTIVKYPGENDSGSDKVYVRHGEREAVIMGIVRD